MQAPHRKIRTGNDRESFLLRLLDALWKGYRARVEYARRYERLVEDHGAVFLNDHIAFRTFAAQKPSAGIFSISRVFEALGYRPAGCYEFPDRHLNSIHYKHLNPAFPKLFISELKTWELSKKSRGIIRTSLQSYRQPLGDYFLTGPPKPGMLKPLLAFFNTLPWDVPQKTAVEELNRESQFGAWVLVHGHCVNHFTASVDAHGVAALGDIEKTVSAMKEAGIPMKKKIEGEADSPLRQSATQAVMVEVTLKQGRRRIKTPWTYAYFEIAERPWLLNGKTGKKERFEGFFGPQAAQLFDMTSLTRRPTS